jgi:hypothetical protein
MADPQRRSPYQGLDPFDEKDADFFFGREKETRLIIANLFASPLTILYGASGVGKSSVLRAGVVYQLHQRDDILVVVFRAWQGDPISDLKMAITNEASRVTDGIRPPPDSLPRAEYLSAWTQKLNRRIMLIFDQFEEYFLYHPQDDAFADEFPKIVTQRDLPISFLIAIREDSITKLDRFKGRIPGLFDNYLRLEHLDRQAATAAIVEPVKTYNRLQGDTEIENHVEPGLADAAIDQVKTGSVLIGEVGRGQIATPTSRVQVETPYLQIVMTHLWDEKTRAGSHILRVEMLKRLGGATRIVRTHLGGVMQALSLNEQSIAASAFAFLVTPSGNKIAYTDTDLAQYAEVRKEDLNDVLQKLCESHVRILRQITPPPNQPEVARYEIFHDVLAPAILEWRSSFLRGQSESRENIFWTGRKRAFFLCALVIAPALVFVWHLISVFPIVPFPDFLEDRLLSLWLVIVLATFWLLVGTAFAAQFLFPVRTLRARINAWWCLWAWFIGFHRQGYIVRNGKAEDHLRGNRFEGLAGVLLVDSTSAAVMDDGLQYRRTLGPNVVQPRWFGSMLPETRSSTFFLDQIRASLWYD